MKKSLLLLGLLLVLGGLAAGLAFWRGASPVVSACAGSVPQGAFVAYRAQAADGNCLQGYVWAPPAEVRGVLVVVHGLHDHARRYERLAQALNGSGVAVIAQDHRGHGGSGGAPQRLDSVAQLLGDVDLARAEAQTRFPGVPQLLYGHSMGGMVAAQHAARQPKAWSGVVLSSAALVLPPGVTPGKARVVSLLSALAPQLGLEAVDEALLVREPAQRQAMAADTVLIRDPLPARTVSTLLSGVIDLQGRWPALQAPLLLMHGAQDQVTDPAGSRLALDQAASTQKQRIVFEQARHDLLHEPESAQVIQNIDAFVASRLK